jgi:hypothetical protein
MKGLFNVAFFVLFWAVASILTFGIALVPLGVLMLLTYLGAEERAQKAKSLISSTLMDDEQVIAQSIQHRVFALWSRRNSLAITNSRIILIARGLFGGFRMSDIQWKDLQDVRIEQNVLSSFCGSNLGFQHLNNSVEYIRVDGVERDVASTMYSHAQAQEQAWEEKRRVRAMEEIRAAAGGVVVNTGPSGQATAAASGDLLDQIQRAKKLLDDGVISDAEFQEMKAKLISS